MTFYRKKFKPSEKELYSKLRNSARIALNLAENLDYAWDIFDVYPSKEDPGLVLIHQTYKYNPRSQDELNLRGAIIDVKTNKVVCPGIEFTDKREVTDVLKVENGEISCPTIIKDTYYKNILKLKQEDTKLYLGLECMSIRIFKWNDKVFFSSLRKIDARNGRLILSMPTFKEIYDSLGGMNIDDLFDSNDSYSPYCYYLLLVFDEIKKCTFLSSTGILHVKTLKAWEERNGESYSKEPIPYTCSKPIFQKELLLDQANLFIKPRNLSKEELSEMKKLLPEDLKNGRIKGGESIAIFTKDEKGQSRMYFLSSPNYASRTSIANKSNNLYMDYLYFLNNVLNYKRDYIKMRHDIAKTISKCTTRENKIKSATSIFLNCLPEYFQTKAKTFDEDYIKDLEILKQFLKDYSKDESLKESIKASDNPHKEKLKFLSQIKGVEDILEEAVKIKDPTPFIEGQEDFVFYRILTKVRNYHNRTSEAPEQLE